LEQLYSTDFQANLHKITNPYGEGGASEKVVSTLKNSDIVGIVMKTFYDLPNNSESGRK
jgi:GDP/UDP-N,N'-diacetylbacillosamine 2-epimerase (hydrolysing)